MINIKQLSIGNWVNYHPGWEDEETGRIVYECGTGFPVKIEMIFYDCERGMVQYNDGQNDGIEAYDYELFPIEITPEILEKNGWKYENGYSDTVDSIGRMIEYYHFEGILRLYVDDKPYTTIGSGLMYVHQLQNALTLCGINKNIGL